MLPGAAEVFGGPLLGAGEDACAYSGVGSGAGEVGEFVGAAGQDEAKNGAGGSEGIHGLRFCDALI